MEAEETSVADYWTFSFSAAWVAEASVEAVASAVAEAALVEAVASVEDLEAVALVEVALAEAGSDGLLFSVFFLVFAVCYSKIFRWAQPPDSSALSLGGSRFAWLP